MAFAPRQAAPPPRDPLDRKAFMEKAGQIFDGTVGKLRANATFTEYEAAAVQASRELGLLVLQQQLARRAQAEGGCQEQVSCPCCGRQVQLDRKGVPRGVESLTGAVRWPRAVYRCPHCRRRFSPSGLRAGAGGGELQPGAAGTHRRTGRHPGLV